MTRPRAVLVSLVVLVLVASGCTGGGTTAISDPAILPGQVGADAATSETSVPPAPSDAGADPADDAVPVEAPEPGGFVLDLPEGSLPTGPADGNAAGTAVAPTDIAFVQRSIDTMRAEPYSYTVTFAMSVDAEGKSFSIAPTAPLASGEFDGVRQRTMVDLGTMFESMLSEMGDLGGGADVDLGQLTALFGDDLSIETIVDGTVVYLRAPMLGMLGAFGAADVPGELAQLGDGWGMVDLAEVPGVSAADIAELTGAQSASSPDQILAMLDDLGSVTEIGSVAIDGTATTRYSAVIDVEAILAADAAELQDLEGLGMTSADLAAFLGDGPVVDLFIDESGNLRRMTLAMTADALPGGGSFAVSTTIDMFDHGAAITIDVPTGAVDLTDSFAELAELGYGPI